MIKRAFPLLIEAQKQFPKDPDVTAGLALVLYLKGLDRQAAAAFELSFELRPDVRLNRDAAAAYEAEGNSDMAIRDLNTAIKADPSDENAYRMLADIFHGLGNRSSETRVLNEYLMFRPASIEFRQRRSALNINGH
jgi:predicted Zn-dependent protease